MKEDLTREAVLEQLARMLSSPDFTAGPRVQKFLTHLVNEELDGRGELLRGTALAMDVFGRGADFDSNNDPIVRIEAVKLRKAIEHYYLTSGTEDDIVISVPKGRYRPEFERRKVAPAQRAAPSMHGLPTLAILRFEGGDSEKAQLYRDGLPEEIALELARFGQIRVISGWLNTPEDDESVPAELEGRTNYILRGNVREAAGSLRVSVQLSRVPGETLVWSDRFRVGADEADPFEVQERIARQCATRMADAYGAVAEDLSAQFSGRAAADASVFEALLAFHAHMRTSRLASLQEFRDLSEAAVRDNPSSGLAHALVAIGLIEAASLGVMPVSDIIDPGRGHAEKAIALAPNCQEALFAAAAFAQARGDDARYRNLIDRAVEANQNGTLLTALAGGWFAKAGDFEKGLALVDDARARNPLLPIWTTIALAIRPLVEGDFQTASAMVRHVDARDSLYDWMLIAAAHELAGQHDLAREALSVFDRAQLDPVEYASTIPMSPELAQRLQVGLTAAQEKASSGNTD
ncbi:TolB-like protein [Aliiruegeria haliotis]|uniref:TolB-like protein n=1 Tax=Aliiruegeria haliotis TaxID=1280846 RepID=A0A2T0RPW6_9RHOB|nr:hypothetical protein [Aliiruegeria haliotis]PRY23182.1 TolB-like protein [Aliiruegeria haliotis]